ncbi:hypothetical protein EMCRGX_G005508 [Ephydatia muelleri]
MGLHDFGQRLRALGVWSSGWAVWGYMTLVEGLEPYVLSRQRHTNILKRLANAVPHWKGRQYKEQMVPGDSQGLKPDLVVLNDTTKEAFIVDVTMPFEGMDTFSTARPEKERKYNHLKALSSKGYNKVEVDALVVRPLESWDKDNEAVLRKLSVSRKRRRNQGHLSSPSTDGEATPPPPHPVKKPIPSTCNSNNPITPPDPSGSNGPPFLSLNSRDSNSSPIRAAGASPALLSAQWPVSNC